jgi:hypothetical protein
VEENKRRDAENTKLKARIEELESENVEFRDRITKVEQRQMLKMTQREIATPNASARFVLSIIYLFK